MEATHILLGRSWLYERKTLHDGLTNKISFTFHGHKVTLTSLSPKEVDEDQLKMNEKREKKNINRIIREAFSFHHKRLKR